MYSDRNILTMSLSILCRENKLIFNKCYKLKKPWCDVQIHEGANDDDIIERKHFEDIDYNLQDKAEK